MSFSIFPYKFSPCFILCMIGLLLVSQKVNSQDQAESKKNKIFNKKKSLDKERLQEKEDTMIQLNKVKLKNGLILYGQVVKQTQDSLKLRLSQNELTFHQDQVKKVSKFSPKKRTPKDLYMIMDIGYTIGNYTDSLPSDSSPIPRSFAIQAIAGQQLTSRLAVEMGVGLMLYKQAYEFVTGDGAILPFVETYEPTEGIFIPIHLGIRGDILKAQKVTPTGYGEFGYGFLLGSRKRNIVDLPLGGIFYSYGAGIKFNGSQNISTILTVGQQSQFIEWQVQEKDGFGMPIGGVKYEQTWYNRLVIKLSLMFH